MATYAAKSASTRPGGNASSRASASTRSPPWSSSTWTSMSTWGDWDTPWIRSPNAPETSAETPSPSPSPSPTPASSPTPIALVNTTGTGATAVPARRARSRRIHDAGASRWSRSPARRSCSPRAAAAAEPAARWSSRVSAVKSPTRRGMSGCTSRRSKSVSVMVRSRCPVQRESTWPYAVASMLVGVSPAARQRSRNAVHHAASKRCARRVKRGAGSAVASGSRGASGIPARRRRQCSSSARSRSGSGRVCSTQSRKVSSAGAGGSGSPRTRRSSSVYRIMIDSASTTA